MSISLIPLCLPFKYYHVKNWTNVLPLMDLCLVLYILGYTIRVICIKPCVLLTCICNVSYHKKNTCITSRWVSIKYKP